jgi:hypothetical protein
MDAEPPSTPAPESQAPEQYPAPPHADLARVRAQLLDRFPGRVPVLIAGCDPFEPGPFDGGARLCSLVERFAERVGASAVADNVLLVGSCAHAGFDGKQAWDSVIQQTVCDLRDDAVPMIKLLFYNSAVSRGALIGHRGNHTAVTIACSDETNALGEPIARQGWKAFLAPVGLCFGGGPRARLLVSTQEDCARFKPGALPVPAAGGAHHSELIDGACKDWRPEGVAEATWLVLKAKREGDLTSADELDAYVDTLLVALEGVVATAAKAQAAEVLADE